MRQNPHKLSFRFRLLIPVNIILFAIAAIVLGYDTQYEQTRRLSEKGVALKEEAKTLLPAVNQIRSKGRSHVQQYIDAVCGQMRESESPGHHIVVKLGDEVLQALSHGVPSAELLDAMREASESPARTSMHQGSELLVGTHIVDGTIVFVSEKVANVRQSAMDDTLRRLAAFAVLQLVGAILINAILLRIVVRPIFDLKQTVEMIADGKYSLHTGSFRSDELDALAQAINVMSVELALRERDQKHHGMLPEPAATQSEPRT